MIFDVNGSITTELGPYHMLRSDLSTDIVHHDISSGLLTNEEYYLNVTLVAFPYMITSDTYYFGIVKSYA